MMMIMIKKKIVSHRFVGDAAEPRLRAIAII